MQILKYLLANQLFPVAVQCFLNQVRLITFTFGTALHRFLQNRYSALVDKLERFLGYDAPKLLGIRQTVEINTDKHLKNQSFSDG